MLAKMWEKIIKEEIFLSLLNPDRAQKALRF